jgi:hypothetical protein
MLEGWVSIYLSILSGLCCRFDPFYEPASAITSRAGIAMTSPAITTSASAMKYQPLANDGGTIKTMKASSDDRHG